MSGIVGGFMTCGGVLKIFDVANRASFYLNRGVQGTEDQNISKSKLISRIVANMFALIGHFSVALGMITMGATLYSALPTTAFLVALNEGLIASLPYLIGSLAGLTLGLIGRTAAQ